MGRWTIELRKWPETWPNRTGVANATTNPCILQKTRSGKIFSSTAATRPRNRMVPESASTRGNSKHRHSEGSVASMRTLDEPFNEIDSAEWPMHNVLEEQQSDVIVALNDPARDEHPLNAEPGGLKQPADTRPTVVAVTQVPRWIQWGMQRAGMRCREIELAVEAEHAVRLTQRGAFSTFRKVFDDVKQTCTVKGFVAERQGENRSFHKRRAGDGAFVAHDDPIDSHVLLEAPAQCHRRHPTG